MCRLARFRAVKNGESGFSSQNAAYETMRRILSTYLFVSRKLTTELLGQISEAGFEAVDIESTRVYSIEDARTFLAGQGHDVSALAKEVEGKFISGFIRAVKPMEKSCCAPSCCQ